MTVKSIIEIDVQDGAFKRFQSLYSKYEQSLKKTPEAWAAVGKKIDGTRKGFDAIVAGMVASNVQARLHVEAQAKADRLTRTTADKWKDIATSTKSAASNVLSITTSLIKWSALSTAFTGLVGVGSLFGLDRLGASVSRGRQSALGLGLSYGQQQSFDINASRFVDPSSFLSTIAQARGDVSKRTSLYGAGLTDAQISGGNTSDTAVAVLRGLKRIADTTDPRLFQQRIQAGNLGDITSVEGLNKLKETKTDEFNRQLEKIRLDVKSLEVSKDTLLAWQDFTTQMNRAGGQIESIFVKGLGELTKPLTELSEATVEVVKAFLHTDLVKDGLESLKVWLTGFAETVKQPAFADGVKNFANDVVILAKQVGSAVEWLSSWFKPSGKGGKGGEVTFDSHRSNFDGSAPASEGDARLNGWARYLTGADSASVTEKYIREAAAKRGIDPSVAVAVARSEGLNSYVGDKGTSFGPYQLHYKNNIPGLSDPGLGDVFTSKTGKDARDPGTTQDQIDFALDYAKANGWGPWHGWKGDKHAGIGSTNVTITNKTGADVNSSVNNLANAGQAN